MKDGELIHRLLASVYNVPRVDSPAFFSWTVKSDQFSFMRSRRAIHSSACSCSGMPSHLFSMLARVGFEIAWPAETTVEAAAREMREVVVA